MKPTKEQTFPVHGDTPENRRAKVEAVFDLSPMAGFLLSAVNFEWTIRRAILALGWDSTKNIRSAFKDSHGARQYKNHWKTFVCGKGRSGRPRLPALIRSISNHDGKGRPIDWTDILKAYNVRHIIVHGRSCTASTDFLRRNTDVFLRTAEILVAFVKENGGDVYKTIRRYKPQPNNSN